MEHVILLDAQGTPCGTQEKYAAHHSQTPLHLAFSCWLFNDRQQLLLTRRALGKKAWPGVWTNSVCGHPQTGELFEQAIARRCQFEIGVAVADITPVFPDFSYCETDSSGIVENERCPVYAARQQSEIEANPDEVMDYHWIALDDLQQAITAAPFMFSPWMRQQFSHLPARQRLKQFAGI
ncbi:isopentenyl-diphosphate Delta-isomerase [uncultured Pluralibacter sp.]|uniref:isopentenyl-diphosphate Delta-isomerase n=1 Tax=uncultured Pluralibacter sp. TaxID=1490864 RepID=UPI00262759FC|nr:isopentenyl-diphosphate Delta-isomerase [uncultured Pluralibacter sp.]